MHFDNDALLHSAIFDRRVPIVRYLLRECHADPNGRDGAMLYQACCAGNVEIVRELLECGADISRRYRGRCVMGVGNGVEIVKVLVEHGADPQDGLESACLGGDMAVAEFLVRQGADPRVGESRVLRVAVEKGASEEFVEFLILEGCDVHACGDEGIKNAAIAGRVGVVKGLLRYGEFEGDVVSWAAYGAGVSGHLEVVEVLVGVGADLHVRDEMLLRHAVRSGLVNVVRYLLGRGADVLLRPRVDDGEKAWTALEEAVLRGEDQMLREVLREGKCWADEDGIRSALVFANSLGRREELLMLLRSVAPPGTVLPSL